MALLMRTQLSNGNDFLTKDSYNEVMTMHGTTMVFLVVVRSSPASATSSCR